MTDDVRKTAKRLFKATLVFERFSDYKAFLNSMGTMPTTMGVNNEIVADATILMPQQNDEGQARLDVVKDDA